MILASNLLAGRMYVVAEKIVIYFIIQLFAKPFAGAPN